MTRKRTLRTDLEPEVWEGLARLADEAGRTLAAYARDVLTSHTLHKIAAKDGPPFEPLTTLEIQEVKAWMVQHSGGTGPGFHKSWRAGVDKVLRDKGVPLPPLPATGSAVDHEALLRWAHRVEPHLSPDLPKDQRVPLPRAKDFKA